jgi:hypothetical protein
VRYRTDAAAPGTQHGAMKNPLETFTARYTEWVNTGWSMVTGTPLPAKQATPKAAQAEAEQEWEDEGGSVKPEKKPEPKT